jgi:DNA-directed RNA polymerase III subunit RPC3
VVILEQHGLVTFRVVDRRTIVYSMRSIDVRRLTMSTRCIFTAKTLFGELAETIVEELFLNGRLTYDQCISRTAQRLDAGMYEYFTI